MAYWTFSDVFEEQGVVKEPFYGGFGLIAAGGIPKPAFNVFKLLHRLGDRRLPVASTSLLVTERADSSLVIAAWNLVDPEQVGTPKTMHLRFVNLPGPHLAYISRVDNEHGDVHSAYKKMGRPRYPTQQQLKALQQASELPSAEVRELTHRDLTLEIPPNGLVVLEIR